jgi:hypothetical protein
MAEKWFRVSRGVRFEYHRTSRVRTPFHAVGSERAPLAIVGTAIGMLAFAVFWDGKTRLFASEGGIGVIVSLILLLFAIAFPRAFN